MIQLGLASSAFQEPAPQGLGVPEQHSKPWDPALSPSASPTSLPGKNQGDQVQGLLPQFTTQGCF